MKKSIFFLAVMSCAVFASTQNSNTVKIVLPEYKVTQSTGAIFLDKIESCPKYKTVLKKSTEKTEDYVSEVSQSSDVNITKVKENKVVEDSVSIEACKEDGGKVIQFHLATKQLNRLREIPFDAN